MRRDTAADHLASPSTAPCRGDWIRWKRAAASSIQLARSRTRLMLEARRGRPAQDARRSELTYAETLRYGTTVAV